MQLVDVDLDRRRPLDGGARTPAAARAPRAVLHRADRRVEVGYFGGRCLDVGELLVHEDDDEDGVDALV